jgi:hypothetical protein
MGEKKWRAELARATVEVLKRTDPKADYMNRRRQIYRVFEEIPARLIPCWLWWRRLAADCKWFVQKLK